VNAAVIVAGGSGDRFGREGGKQLAPVGGAPLIAHTLRAFEASGAVDAVVVVCHPDRVGDCRAAVESSGASKVVAVVPGGETRRMSVAAGLAALPPECDVVAVHDGARALVEEATIDAAIAELASRPDADGVVVGHPAFDTMKDVDASGRVVSTLDRSCLWVAQTPQVFRRAKLARAHDRAAADGFEGTDDASLVERDGGTVMMLQGPRWNFKVTVPEDLEVLEVLLDRRHATGEPS
jgi:2-C-methyl-D-erythritol 4-phosphate cytidylyltransferase